MTSRIRGHYRIDSCGRVQKLGDVNGSAKPYTIPVSVLHRQPSYRRARLRQISTTGMTLFVLGVLLLALMPQIERMVLSAQSARLASARLALVQDLAKHK